MTKSRVSGFTLIELLVVIAIIALLAVVVFVALNPTLRFQQARNSHRWNDVNSILTAIHQYSVDNNGSFPAAITTSQRQLGTCISGGDTACSGADTDCMDLSSYLERYLITMPIDPLGTTGTTKYSVQKNSFGEITVKACAAEDGQVIQVSR